MKWQLWLLFPWFIPLISYSLLGSAYLSDWKVFVGATVFNGLLGFTCQLLLDWVTQRIIAWYPSLRYTTQRLLLMLGLFTLITVTTVVLGLSLYTCFGLFGYESKSLISVRTLFFSGVVNLISVGIYESMYSINRWNESVLEKEQLRKVNLQSQYESLKNQVNPHFLFNTLNTLSSLIADEPERAEAFVDEMAKVYRYLLQTNRRTDNDTAESGELTTVQSELSFIQSFFHLLKTRYGPGIQLNLSVTHADQRQLVPPLTLQMLVENAVKHNVIHVGKPLTIEIKSAPGGSLLIRNNLQRKTTPILSNQVGLSNIQAKYRLLAGAYKPLPDVVIEETESYFTVILPLLKPTRL